ncbi:MAG: FecR domain-containing protein, partial [Woeseiaceae bacterium]
ATKRVDAEMSDMGKDTRLDNDDAVEELLGKAAPRPAPPDAETEAVREAVRAEWQEVTGRRRSRTRITQWAMAASVLVAVFVSLNMLGTNRIEQIQVASVARHFGAVTVSNQNSELLQPHDLTGFVAGESVRTKSNAGISLAWAGGGSLRLDENSLVEFVSDTEVYLHEGRIYFDSEPALSAGTVPGANVQLTIQSEFGEVEHIGTQYMAHTDREALTVSVREGEVVVRPERGATATAGRNQQMAISGSGLFSTVNILSHGGIWEWVEDTAPAASLDGRSIDEFLGWVTRETGLELAYENDSAESYADQETLNGILETGPREALNLWMRTTDLEWRIDDGVIYVSRAR